MIADAQETARKLEQTWLQTEVERQRLLILQVKTLERLRLANMLLVIAAVALIWAILVIVGVL